MNHTIETRPAWRVPPVSKWAFRNVDAIVPTAPIENAPGDIARLLPARKQWAPGLLHRRLLDFTSTDAMVVLVNGALVFEYYANGNGPQTPHILMSCSKAVTGLLLGMLAVDGLIDDRAAVTRYVPEMAGTRYAGATLRDLIDMRAGVILDADEQRAYDLAVNWEPADVTPPTANLKSFFKTLIGPAAVHGGPFRYVSANTDLLGWAIERATGTTIARLLGERLWAPMGAESRAHVSLDQDGLARCAGGVCATARDFARLGQTFLSGGQSGDRAVIPAAVIDDIRTNADRTAWATGEWGRMFAPIAKSMGYRSGWYIVDDAPGCVFAMGIHGQNLLLDFENRMVVAKFSSWKAPIVPLPLLATHKAFARAQRSLKRAENSRA